MRHSKNIISEDQLKSWGRLDLVLDSKLPTATPSKVADADGWLHFTIKGTPVPAPRQSRRDAWKPRPCVIRYREYKDRVRAQAPLLPENPSHLVLSCWLPMPPSWSKKKTEQMKGAPHRQKPDTDNLTKSTKDALWEEDSSIWSETCRKFWDDGKGPRVEVSCK